MPEPMPDAVMRLYPRRALWGRTRWWYDCSACGTTSGPFADQEAATSDVGRHAAERHQSAPDDTDLTEADIDRMMANATPVQIVNGPPPTYAAPAPEPGLRERRARYAAAIHRYDYEHGLSGNDIPSEHHRGEADAVLNVRDAELQQLRAELAEARQTARTVSALHRSAEGEVTRIHELAERWRHTPGREGGPLRELLAALDQQEQP